MLSRHKSFCNKSLKKRLFLIMSNPISFQKLGAAGSVINYFYYSSNFFPGLWYILNIYLYAEIHGDLAPIECSHSLKLSPRVQLGPHEVTSQHLEGVFNYPLQSGHLEAIPEMMDKGSTTDQTTALTNVIASDLSDVWSLYFQWGEQYNWLTVARHDTQIIKISEFVLLMC